MKQPVTIKYKTGTIFVTFPDGCISIHGRVMVRLTGEPSTYIVQSVRAAKQHITKHNKLHGVKA